MPAVDLTRTPFAPLGAYLLDLLHALDGHEIPLILVGGFGLFLRQEHLAAEGTRTLFPGVSPARATEALTPCFSSRYSPTWRRCEPCATP